LFAMERAAPLRRGKAGFLPRLGINAVISALSLLTAAVIVRPAVFRAMGFGLERRAGLLSFLGLPAAVQALGGFVLLDLSFYYWHRANHRIPLLWRFHVVHHVDP